MTKQEMKDRIAKLDEARRSSFLVCTRDENGGWNHSSMSGCGFVELYIYRFEGNKLIKHPWYGKKWKYSSYEEIQLIEHLLDKLGLMLGSLKHYKR